MNTKPIRRIDATAFPPIDEGQVMALKAMWRGDANGDMQVTAMNWIVRVAARLGDISFEDDPHRTSLNEGKRMVGFWLMKVRDMPLEAFIPKTRPATNRRKHD